MKFEQAFDFDYSADVIFRMFTDQDYFLEKYERLSNREPRLLNCDSDDDRFSITVRHVLDAAMLEFPDILAKRVGDRVTLRQTDVWERTGRTGRVDIDIEKSPVEIVVDMQLIERKGKARLELAFDITANIPLIGKQVEKAVKGPISRYMQQDLQLSNEMAAAYVDQAAPQ